MTWNQIIDPFASHFLSLVVALLPIIFIFWALIILKMKGHESGILALIIALAIAIGIYRMPPSLAVLSVAHGALYGLFPICWIFFSAILLFNITVASGKFETIKNCIASISPDIRLQVILIAFCFGSFLEGTAGFGAPVAISAAILCRLGMEPVHAAGPCLLANTAPVAFGSIGIPITVASQVSGQTELLLARMVGRTMPLLSLIIPAYLTILYVGFRLAREVLPAILVAGLSFAFFQFFVSNYLGPALPDIVAGIGSILALWAFLRIWKPKKILSRVKLPEDVVPGKYSLAQILTAFAPFITLTVIVITWGLAPVKNWLNSNGYREFPVPYLHNRILNIDGKWIPQVFKLNFLSAAGTAIFIASAISIPVVGLSISDGMRILYKTIRQLAIPILTVVTILGFAYLMNNSGMTLTISKTLADTGKWFPFFAPVLGWLGVFITGSDTSSNALFGKLQAVTATGIGVNPVVTVSANISGGVVGKMVSPQSIAVAAAAGNLVGQESTLFRYTIKHSLFMLCFICCLVIIQAYVVKSAVPQNDAKNNLNPGRMATGSSSNKEFWISHSIWQHPRSTLDSN